MWNPDEITPIGKTYAQIDEKMQEEVNQANEILGQLANSSARWWDYTVSHNSFSLVVGDASGEQNIVLSLAACSFLSGPVDWKNQKLKVELYNSPPSQERTWSFTIIDETVGFRAEAKVFSWEANYNLLDRKSQSQQS